MPAQPTLQGAALVTRDTNPSQSLAEGRGREDSTRTNTSRKCQWWGRPQKSESRGPATQSSKQSEWHHAHFNQSSTSTWGNPWRAWEVHDWASHRQKKRQPTWIAPVCSSLLRCWMIYHWHAAHLVFFKRQIIFCWTHTEDPPHIFYGLMDCIKMKGCQFFTHLECSK